jgi:hypothetical protein
LRKRGKALHVRDSPGRSARSTPSIDGCTSSVGKGAVGSGSASLPKPSPSPNPIPLALMPDDKKPVSIDDEDGVLPCVGRRPSDTDGDGVESGEINDMILDPMEEVR